MSNEEQVLCNEIEKGYYRWFNCEQELPSHNGVIAVLIDGKVYLACVCYGRKSRPIPLVVNGNQGPLIQYDVAAEEWRLPLHWNNPTHWIQLYAQ